MQTAKNLATGYIVRAQKSQPLRLPFGQTIGSTAHKLDPKPAKTGPMGGVVRRGHYPDRLHRMHHGQAVANGVEQGSVGRQGDPGKSATKKR